MEPTHDDLNRTNFGDKGCVEVAELKTRQHDGDVFEFIENYANTPQKREDSYALVELMEKITGHPPKMWGPSIIGFGKYHYKSERSKQEGDWPLVSFSPRKTAISLYVYTGNPEHEDLLKDLGSLKWERLASMLKNCRTSIWKHLKGSSVPRSII